MTDATEPDLIDILVADHREVESIFAELETGTGDPQHRRDLADVVIAELVRHAVAEEMYLYPAARRVLPDGDGIADHEIDEHAEAERIMNDLDGLDPTDPAFDSTLTRLAGAIRHHIQDEENDLLPRLRATCAAEDLIELGRKVRAAKQIAPTRPHPAAPDRPPFNKLLGPGMGIVDRIRDAVTQRPTSTSDL